MAIIKKESEKFIERKLFDGIKARGGLCIKLLPDQFTGLPDRLCLLPTGILIFVELKAPGKKPRRIQEIVHKKIKALGFIVLVIDTVEGINDLMVEIDERM